MASSSGVPTSGTPSAVKRWLVRFIVLALIVAAFLAGQRFGGTTGGSADTVSQVHIHGQTPDGTAPILDWTCSMHPQIRQPKPGKCPLCFMDLIPVKKTETGGDDRARTLSLSAAARKLAEVRVAEVERRFVPVEVRMVGTVDFDETRLAHITAWVPGRLDRLFVDYTGVTVKKGDHMVYLYSPELLSAQMELLQGMKAVKALEKSGLASIQNTARDILEATRIKLQLWGLTDDQIGEIEKRGTPSDHMTVYAPMGGIVIEKHVAEGMYVNTGTRVYTIADLSHVWVKLDAYETDLAWIRYGQQVEFFSEAYPGNVFTGKIAFIDPVLDFSTRTVKVRVNVPNSDGRLKPGMFVRTVVKARVAAAGRVMDAEMAGKWICPMHPDVVKEQAGTCDICEMPLVRAESLGYVPVVEPQQAPLVIPASAPLITGKRALVYVAVPGEEGTFRGREIVLGPRAGDYYLVRKGLHEGELVVVNGNFKIDSSIQIQAGISMMNPEALSPDVLNPEALNPQNMNPEGSFAVPEAFKTLAGEVLTAYFKIQFTLSRDNFDAAVVAAGMLLEALKAVEMGLLEGEAHRAWMKEEADLKVGAEAVQSAATIEEARHGFALLSESMTAVARRFGVRGNSAVLRYHCPMAFDGRGGSWLQNKEGVENPYYGEMMFRCGEQVEVIFNQP